MKPDWSHQTAVILCSGPSLTPKDCELVKASGHKAIITNSTFRIAPWADVLFAHDSAWWRLHHEEVEAIGFTGLRYSMQPKAPSATPIYGMGWVPRAGNSGACALALAARFGAAKIILLGADCQIKDKAHWHADHPAPLGNAKSVDKWPAQYAKAAKFAEQAGAEVVNCSRETALECIRIGVLEEEL